METLDMTKTDVKVDNKDLLLKDNKVSSDIIPQKSSELKRGIIIEGNVEIIGSVYGEKVVIHHGPVVFNKAAFAKEEFVIDSICEGKLLFKECVGSNAVVSCIPLSTTAIFCSDINAKRVNLKNSYVGGSIYAEEINLEDCVVLGGVFATKKLNVVHSVVGTFNSQEVMMSNVCFLLYPSCFSVEPIHSEETTKLYNLSLADLNGLFKGDQQREGTGKIEINLKTGSQRTSLKDEDGTMLLVNSYSVAGKVLAVDMTDFEKLDNHFLINAGALSSHLMKNYTVTNEKGKKKALDVEEISKFFFDIQSQRIQVNDLDATISFEDLKKKLSDVSQLG